MMEAETKIAVERGTTDRLDILDFNFLPKALMTQCRNLIERYHEVHGFACLPDILWKSRLGPFIERHRELQQFLRKASTTRSAKKSHEGFVRIATTILSLEILASSFAGWGAIYPEAAVFAREILKRNGSSQHMPLMELYLYPPKYISSAAIATLAPPANRRPDLAGEKQALNYVSAMRDTAGGKQAPAVTAPAA